jgi:streptogramin lyase
LWLVVSPNLMHLDPDDGTLTEIKLEEAMTPGFVGIGEGAVWVSDIASEVIYKVDPSSKRVVLRIAAPGLYRDSMIGLGSGALWVVTGGSAEVLTRFDAGSGKAIAQIDLPASCGPGVLYAFGSVWAVGERSRELYRVDPATNKVVGSTALHGEPFAASADATSIWVNSRKDNVLDRIDGVTGSVVATIPTGFRGPEDITTGAGKVWMSFNSSPIVQIDPATNTVVSSYHRTGYSPIRFGDGSLWLDEDLKAVIRVKPPR